LGSNIDSYSMFDAQYIALTLRNVHLLSNSDDHVRIFGDIIVGDSDFLVLDGFVELTGCLYATAASITINNGLSCDSGTLSLASTRHDATQIIGTQASIAGQITVPLLDLKAGSHLTPSPDVLIYGSLRNNGSLGLLIGQTLTVVGNYTQPSMGLVTFYNLTAHPFDIPFLVNGSAFLSGAVNYTLSGEFNDTLSHVVLQSTGSITGQFRGSALSILPNATFSSLDVKYSANQVTLKYGPDGDGEWEFLGLNWKYWAGIAAGALVVLIGISCFAVRRSRSKRSGYETLEGRRV